MCISFIAKHIQKQDCLTVINLCGEFMILYLRILCMIFYRMLSQCSLKVTERNEQRRKNTVLCLQNLLKICNLEQQSYRSSCYQDFYEDHNSPQFNCDSRTNYQTTTQMVHVYAYHPSHNLYDETILILSICFFLHAFTLNITTENNFRF